MPIIKATPIVTQVDASTISVSTPQPDLVTTHTLADLNTQLAQFQAAAVSWQTAIDSAVAHLAVAQDSIASTQALIDQAVALGIKP